METREHVPRPEQPLGHATAGRAAAGAKRATWQWLGIGRPGGRRNQRLAAGHALRCNRGRGLESRPPCSRRWQAMPEKPGLHLQSPVVRSQTPAPEHSSTWPWAVSDEPLEIQAGLESHFPAGGTTTRTGSEGSGSRQSNASRPSGLPGVFLRQRSRSTRAGCPDLT